MLFNEEHMNALGFYARPKNLRGHPAIVWEHEDGEAAITGTLEGCDADAVFGAIYGFGRKSGKESGIRTTQDAIREALGLEKNHVI